MASLTSARARNNRAANSSAGSPSAGHVESFEAAGATPQDGHNNVEMYTRRQPQQHDDDDSKGLDKHSYASRPFGSNVPLSNGHERSQSVTSGWITSGNYVDKGKGKLNASGHHSKTGNGPLRDYGGGLGVVGQGEFKLLLAITALASVVRLWRLDRPDSVVFDEVHFGGASIALLSACSQQAP